MHTAAFFFGSFPFSPPTHCACPRFFGSLTDPASPIASTPQRRGRVPTGRGNATNTQAMLCVKSPQVPGSARGASPLFFTRKTVLKPMRFTVCSCNAPAQSPGWHPHSCGLPVSACSSCCHRVCARTDAPEAAPLSPMHAPSERPAQRKDEPVEPGTWTSALFSPVLKFFGNEEGGERAFLLFVQLLLCSCSPPSCS
jgi:hypothetical protein